MNKLMSYSVVSLLSLAVGYCVYPILNSDGSSQSTSEVKTSLNNSLDDHNRVNKISPSIVAPVALKASSTVVVQQVEQDFSVQGEMPEFGEIAKAHSALDQDNAAAKKAMHEWGALHKTKLQQAITENVPDMLAEGMSEMISQDNNFLSDAEILQDSQLDENWAYIMERDIHSLIRQNSASTDFNLLMLTCKQLTCDILGVEHNSGIWHKIYFNLLRSLPSIQLPSVSDGRKNVSFSEGNVSYIYTQLKFKQNQNN